MADARTNVYKFNIVVRGHHIYTTARTSLIDEVLQVMWKDTNKCDEYIL